MMLTGKDKEGLTEDKRVADPFRERYFDSLETLISEESEKKKAVREKAFVFSDVLSDREKYVDKLKKLIGDPLFDRRKGAKVSETKLGEDDECEVFRLTFNFERGIEFSGLLFVPFGLFGRSPLVVCVHGGDGTPELMYGMYGPNHYSDIVKRIARRGCVVFAPQLMIWGKEIMKSRFSRNIVDSQMKMLGSSMTSFECECIRGAIDSLCEDPRVDPARIGMAGLSYGAYYSVFVSALDTRIKAVYASGIVNDRIKYARPDFSYFNASGSLLDAEVCSLICPRALYLESGRHDVFFAYRTAETEAEKVRGFYKFAGREQRFVFSLTEEGHKYSPYDDGIVFMVSHLE